MSIGSQNAESTKGKILVVDDEKNNRELLHDLLASHGYEVLETADGKEALQVAGQNLPDAILLDVMMPKMDGFEVCRRLKAIVETAHIPILLVTMLSTRKDLLAGIEAGASDFLSKPIDIEETLLRIRNAVTASRLFVENLSLRRGLEKKVQERTGELEKAYQKNLKLTKILQQKVKELEGHDLIQQHLLTIHPLEETLGKVMHIICDVVQAERTEIYLADSAGGGYFLATVGETHEAETVSVAMGAKVNDDNVIAVLNRALQNGETLTLSDDGNIIEEGSGEQITRIVAPIPKGDTSLGAVVVYKKDPNDSDIQTITSFAMQAAVAISDSQMNKLLPDLESALDDILADFQNV